MPAALWELATYVEAAFAQWVAARMAAAGVRVYLGRQGSARRISVDGRDRVKAARILLVEVEKWRAARAATT